MEKLELKHLATAFLDNQKVFYFDEERELNQICKIVELREEELTISNGEYQYDVLFDDIKLLSHHLSDMTNHEMNVLRFLKTSKEGSQWTKSDWNFIKDVQRFPSLQSYKIVQKLFEWHFDVFGLIEKGLAIDINTLRKQP